MVNNILKISKPYRYLIFKLEYCNNYTEEKLCIDRRRYKNRHLIPMFIGTPCAYSNNQKTLEQKDDF